MDKLIQTVEAIVFLSGRAIAVSDIADKLGVTEKEVQEAGAALTEKYAGDSGIHFMNFNKKFQMSTNPEYADRIEQVLSPIREKELTRALLEVMAIIAYRQPITRLEVEELRGVNSDYSIALLAKNGLIEVIGRKDAIGKPLLYGSTDEFLKRFNLNSLEDLPDYATVISRIKILHGAPSADLFHKEEYKEEDDQSLHGQIAIDMGDSAENDVARVSAAIADVAVSEAAATLEQISPLQEEESDGEGIKKKPTKKKPSGSDGEVVLVEDGEELPNDDLPDFLKGEDVEVIE